MIKLILMGKILKQKREELGEELRDISLVVRIRTTYLKAIEEENFEKLPAEVYAKGYIREYARYLNVPFADAVSAYQQYLEDSRDKLAALSYNPVGSYASKCYVPSTSKPSLFLPKLFILCISVAILFGIYVFVRDNWQVMGRDTVAEMPKPMQPPAETLVAQPHAQADHQSMPAEQSIPQSASAQDSASVSSNKADAAKPQTVKPKYNLVVSATDQVWLEINSDDKTRNDIIMNAGETQSFRADGKFKIKIGNAAGVRFSFNGREIGPLGAKGEVVYLTLPESQQSAERPLLPGSQASVPVHD